MSEKSRIRRSLLKRYSIALAVLVIYYILRSAELLSVPCPFHYVTGLRCPGCGMTRMCLHLAKGEFGAAFECNAVMFFLAPLFVLVAVTKLILVPEFLTPECKAYRAAEIVILIILLVFWVLRNIFGF